MAKVLGECRRPRLMGKIENIFERRSQQILLTIAPRLRHRAPTLMTRRRSAQGSQNQNPKSTQNRP